MSRLPPNLSRPNVDASAIIDDRACERCGYNLRGLKVADRCPECATPIRPYLASPSDTLGGASVEFLRVFARGSMLMGATAFPFFALFCATLWCRPGSKAFAPLVGFGVLLGTAWSIGVYLTTTPRPGYTGQLHRPKEEQWNKSRTGTRLTQWAWPAAMVCWLGAAQIPAPAAAPPAAVVLLATGVLCALVGTIGLGFVILYLIRIALWADDTELADRLKLVPVLSVVSLVLLIAAGVIGPMLGGGVVTFSLIPIAGCASLFLVYSLWSLIGVSWRLATIGSWALNNRETELDSAQRRSARIVNRIEGGQTRSRRAAPRPPAPPPPPSSPQGNYIPRVGADPLEIIEPPSEGSGEPGKR
ncbi:MAG: hypothetical protein ACOYN0_00190 [Phycisphaerales bacterium]